MAECRKCGTQTVPGEAFCSNCGTKNAEPPTNAEPLKNANEETTLEYEDTGDLAAPATPAAAAQSSSAGAAVAPATGDAELNDSAALGGHSTGEVPSVVKHTTKKGNTGGRQPTVKQLDPGSVLTRVTRSCDALAAVAWVRFTSRVIEI